jgi:multiple antibiotic resistance protein
MTLLSGAVLLFLVMDPLGNVPVFLTVLKDVDPRRRPRIILRELLIALAVLLIFLYFGRFILKALQIDDPALSIAGGIILFLIALKMIFPDRNDSSPVSLDHDPFIVPLAIPLVAGPSALASVLLMMAREPDRILEWTIALLCAWAVTALILIASGKLSRALGARGLTALTRLMGMILTTISVQMFLNGIRQFQSQ